MSHHHIHEVDGLEFEDTLTKFNALVPEWPLLEPRHFANGHWWLVYDVDEDGPPVACAALVPFDVGNVAYFKRCYVAPDHRGHDLQLRLMTVREVKARELGYFQIVSECAANSHSNANFRKSGFEMFDPEQRWGEPGSVYWRKTL